MLQSECAASYYQLKGEISPMPIPIQNFFLDPDTQGTLQSKIQQMIAQGILTGRYQKGDKLPSTRKLAVHLGVSRITVTLAYTELLASDYITSRGRSGYYVSQTAPIAPKFDTPTPRNDTIDWSRAIGQRYSGGFFEQKNLNWSKLPYPFVYGQTDSTLFDHANWRLCALKALGGKDFAALTSDYYDQDDPQLVEFIARHSLPRRGIIANSNEILVTMGAQNALWLAAQVLLTQRRTATIENPCYPPLLDILQQSRCRVEAVPVDDKGLDPAQLPNESHVIFTTPSHHCPTAATMPLERRRALLDRAAQLDALIVEDDYEFEMSYLAPPSPSLKSLDRDGRVIYIGSFSKSLFPGLRLGYLVGSEPFIREARALRASVLRHPPGHIQRTAAYFLGLGHYDALIRRLSKTFQKRREILEAAIEKHKLILAGKAVFGGTSFWMEVPAHIDTKRLAQNLLPHGVVIEPGHLFFYQHDGPRNFFRLAYSSISAEKIDQGIALIAQEIAHFGLKSP